jgi:two-component system cell cycle sensor histidine kinase PleC
MASATQEASRMTRAGLLASRFRLGSRDSTATWIILGTIATILSIAAATAIQMRREHILTTQQVEREIQGFREFVSLSGRLMGLSLDRTRQTVVAAVAAAPGTIAVASDPGLSNVIAVASNGDVYWDKSGMPSQPWSLAGSSLLQRLMARPEAPFVTGAIDVPQSRPGSLGIAIKATDGTDRIHVAVLNTDALIASLDGIRGQRTEGLFIVDSYSRTIAQTERNSAPPGLLGEVLSSLPPGMSSSPISRELVHEGQRYLASALQIPGYDLRIVSIARAGATLSSWMDYLPLWSIVIFGPSLLGAALAWALLNQMEQTSRSRSALRQTEERFELAVSGARCGIWDWDIESRRMYWSGAMNALLGQGSQPRLIDVDEIERRLHPADQRAIRNIEDSIRAGASDYDETFRLRRDDGAYAWIRAKGQAYRTLRSETSRLSGIALDISDQKSAAERLDATERVLKAAFDNAAEAFALWDRQERLVICNRRFMEFYGLSEAKLGDTRNSLIGRALGSPLQVDGGSVGKSRLGLPAGTVELQRANDRWLLVSERQATPEARIMVATDITALKQHEDALQASHRQLQEQALKLGEIATRLEAEKIRAEEGSRSKTEFLSNMSHELRTPLNAIMGFSDAMRNEVLGPLPPRYVSYASDIHSSGEALLKLIDEVLNMARIESGTVELDIAPTNLGLLVAQSIASIRDEATAAGISIRQQLKDMPLVLADKSAIREVMSNLLSNALKYNSADGFVTVETRMVGDKASVWIHDTGIGIKQSNLSRIIKPFERLEKSTNASRRGGTGLGLAASNALIGLHGGKLTIESEPGIGTSVCFTLPTAKRS